VIDRTTSVFNFKVPHYFKNFVFSGVIFNTYSRFNSMEAASWKQHTVD